jgi:hypothetical protein
MSAVEPLPLIHLDQVFHVGDLNPLSKRQNSYEGSGLSVSLHPDEWREIARGFVAGQTWALHKAGGVFVDAHALTDDQRAEILAWAERESLAIPAQVWQVTLYDDEADQITFQTFSTEEEARAENVDADPSAITASPEYVSAPALDALACQTRQAVGSDHVFDLVLPVWIERCTSADGAWWEDDLDVFRLSAPRGVISALKLAQWRIEPATTPPEYGD